MAWCAVIGFIVFMSITIMVFLGGSMAGTEHYSMGTLVTMLVMVILCAAATFVVVMSGG